MSEWLARLVSRLRERPYDEIRYRWEREEGTHTVTCIMSGRKVSVMITEEFILRARSEVMEVAILRWDQEFWDQLTAEERR